MNSLEHEKYIRQTLEIAAQAVRDGDHPFGALMVLDGEVVSSSGNC
jgi:tRNA(Arg) A34 adenosine deaminase TadA